LIKLILKYYKDLFRLRFNKDGNTKFSRIIYKYINKGIYLDIGCYHPVKESHTAYLYNRGWNGYNIDIDHNTIKLFNIFRKKDTNINLGLSYKNGTHYAYFEKDISAVSSLDKNYLSKIGRATVFKKKIRTVTLGKLRQDLGLKKINFLTIDCEGMDEKIILKSKLKDLEADFLCIEILPQTIFGWKNFNFPPGNIDKFCIKYFLKSSIYRKLKKIYTIKSNEEYTFLLKLR